MLPTGGLEMASWRITDEEMVRPCEFGAAVNDPCVPEIADTILEGETSSGMFATPCAATADSAWLLAAFVTTSAGEDPAFVEATAIDELLESVFGAGVPLPLPTAMTTTFSLATGEGLDFDAETMVT